MLNFRLERLPTTLMQTYARSGEEFFTRGFIFLFALRIFRNQKWPAPGAKKRGKSPAFPNEGSS